MGSTVKSAGYTVFTPMFRLCYVNVFETRKDDKGQPTNQYDCEAIFELPSTMSEAEAEKWAKLMALGKAAWAKMFGDDFASPKETPKFDWPVKKGEEVLTNAGKQRAELMGKIKIQFKSKNFQPGAAKLSGQGAPVPIVNKSELYPGCWCIAEVNAYAWTYGGKNGVTFGLSNILKVKDGDPLGFRSDPVASFGKIDVAKEYGVNNESMFAAAAASAGAATSVDPELGI